MEIQSTSEMTPYFTMTKCNKLFITYVTRSTERLPSLSSSISTISTIPMTVVMTTLLAMETDEERKARLKKMVATTLLKLAPETEDERRARLEYLSDNPIYIPNNLYLILIVAF